MEPERGFQGSGPCRSRCAQITQGLRPGVTLRGFRASQRAPWRAQASAGATVAGPAGFTALILSAGTFDPVWVVQSPWSRFWAAPAGSRPRNGSQRAPIRDRCRPWSGRRTGPEGVDLSGTTVVVNPEFGEGMGSRFAGAAAAAPSKGPVLIRLGDQPFVSPATLRALVERHAAGTAKILVPTFEGVRGNPVLLIGGAARTRRRPGRHRMPSDFSLATPRTWSRCRSSIRRPHRRGYTGGVDRLEQALEGHPSPSAGGAPPPRGGPSPCIGKDRCGDSPGPVSSPMCSRWPPSSTRGSPSHWPRSSASCLPRREKPGSRPPFARTGRSSAGSVGAAPVGVLLAEALQSMEDGTPRRIRLSPDAEEGGMPTPGVVTRLLECESGGTMEIYVEPHLPQPELLIVGEAPPPRRSPRSGDSWGTASRSRRRGRALRLPRLGSSGNPTSNASRSSRPPVRSSSWR